MTQLLEKAFAEASRLPEAEQDVLARRMLAEIASEAGSLTQDYSPDGKPGKTYLPFAHAIDAEDLSRMETAIEEGCEQVNPDEW
jgi:hypothetical protein